MYVIQGQAERDTGTEVWAVGIVEEYSLAVEIQCVLEDSQEKVLDALISEDDPDNYHDLADSILEDAKYRDEYGEDWIKTAARVEYSICSAPFLTYK